MCVYHNHLQTMCFIEKKMNSKLILKLFYISQPSCTTNTHAGFNSSRFQINKQNLKGMDLNKSTPRGFFNEKEISQLFPFSFSSFFCLIFWYQTVWNLTALKSSFLYILGSQGASSVSDILEPQRIRLPSQKQKSWYLNYICFLYRHSLLCCILRVL